MFDFFYFIFDTFVKNIMMIASIEFAETRIPNYRRYSYGKKTIRE